MGKFSWPCVSIGLLTLAAAGWTVLAWLFPFFPGDQPLFLMVQGWRREWLNAVALAVTTLSWAPVAVGIGLACTAGLFLARRYRDALLVVMLLVLAGAGHALKLVVQRPRPPYPVIGTEPGSFSFPSGHAIFAIMLGGVALLLVQETAWPRWVKYLVQAIVVLLVLAVGASRVYLGVHWPSDVLGGYLFGLPVLWGLLWLRARW